MVKEAGEAGVDMITDLVKQIIVLGVIPVERELSTIEKHYYKRKDNSLGRGNYRGLTLNLFWMGLFGAGHRWREGKKASSSLKSVTHILQ